MLDLRVPLSVPGVLHVAVGIPHEATMQRSMASLYGPQVHVWLDGVQNCSTHGTCGQVCQNKE